jgi:hypothetical protein
MQYQNAPLHNAIRQSHTPIQAQPQPMISRTPPVPIEQTLPQAINYGADYSGCGIWRMVWPQYILNATQSAVVHNATTMILDPRFYQTVKCVRIQRQATPNQKKFVEFLKGVSKDNGMRVIYEVDDIIFREDIPDYNNFKEAFEPDEIRKASEEIMMLCDEITVTCPFMKDYYHKKTGHPKITVIPNMPPRFWLGHEYNEYKISKNYKKHCRGRRAKPRILYAGSGAHFDVGNKNNQQDDFTHVNKVITKTIDKYQWVFVAGVPPVLQPLVKSGKIEMHPWQSILNLPNFISQLEINCIIAPLQDNTFNRGKSDIKFIEASAHGIPIVCQDIVTYKDAHIKFTTGEELIAKIDSILESQSKYLQISRRANKSIQGRWLEDNIGIYKELYSLPYGHKDRINLNKLNYL